MPKDITRLSFILLFAPFALWILLLIILPHIGMVVISLRDKVAPRVYEFSFANAVNPMIAYTVREIPATE